MLDVSCSDRRNTFFFGSIDSVVHSIVFAVLLAPATGRSILTIKSILFYSYKGCPRAASQNTIAAKKMMMMKKNPELSSQTKAQSFFLWISFR